MSPRRTQAGHTTYRLGPEPSVGVLWTYADRQADGTLQARSAAGPTTRPPTPGARAPSTPTTSPAPPSSTCGTGSRPATPAAGTRRSRLLRGLTYLQTATRPQRRQRGAVDAARRHAEPQRRRRWSCRTRPTATASYWLARTIWALGEGYAAFRAGRPRRSPRFLRDRLDLGHRRAATVRCSSRYGQLPRRSTARRTPAWLIVDGADATAEAVLGLPPTSAPAATPAARDALRAAGRRHRGDAPAATPRAAGRSARVLPWALSRSDWHAWASQMPAALAARPPALGRPRRWPRRRSRDSATFDPWLLTSGGPDNGRLPTRIDAHADRLRRRLPASSRCSRPPTAAGRTACGTSPASSPPGSSAPTPSGRADLRPGHRASPSTASPADGTVNHNSGAESTIHGLLDDARARRAPGGRGRSRTHRRDPTAGRHGRRAGRGRRPGRRTPTPWCSPAAGPGSRSSAAPATSACRPAARCASRCLAGDARTRCMPVVDLQPGSTAVTTFRSGRHGARHGAVRRRRAAG